jgi:hypothetical protein
VVVIAKLPKQIQFLLQKISDEDIPTIKRGKRMRLGDLYLYTYFPKHASTLPYYDILPTIVLLGMDGKYLHAINMHYIPYLQRLQLIKAIEQKRSKGVRLQYKHIKAAWRSLNLPKAYMYLAYRTYLISHITSNIKWFEAGDEPTWTKVLQNIGPRFKKKSNSAVIRDIQKKMREAKAKSRQSKK